MSASNQGGCYAASGPIALHWRKVSDGRAGGTYAEFLLVCVAALLAGRFAVCRAGDLPGEGDAIDAGMLAQVVDANHGKRGFLFAQAGIGSWQRCGDRQRQGRFLQRRT